MAHDFLCQAPASLVIAEALSNQVNHADIESIIQSQKHVLGRLEKTNEMLLNCNSLSATRFALANQELKKHTQLLFDLKKDLDSVFRRIRRVSSLVLFLKMKLSQQYPAAFSACSKVFNVLDEEDEPEEKVISAKKKAVEQADILCDASSAQKNTESTGSPSSGKSSTTSYNSDDS
ncbi:unnamed protein product [Ixodes persulcatus]